jgi:hypothetical protein
MPLICVYIAIASGPAAASTIRVAAQFSVCMYVWPMLNILHIFLP